MLLKPKVREIEKRRIELGLSKRQLSLQSGIGGSSICRIESGRTTQIHGLRASAIAKTLKC
ncbi:MAG: helix-turn-helix domain-containing protein, partial [Anaerovoracaceae bacterium]